MALQIVDLLEAVARDSGHATTRLRVDGGAASNNLLMQTQADLLGVNVDRPPMLEATGLGAALVAGLGAGVFQSLEDLGSNWSLERRFEPEATLVWRREQMARWSDAITRC
jgi:glycerol kinase